MKTKESPPKRKARSCYRLPLPPSQDRGDTLHLMRVIDWAAAMNMPIKTVRKWISDRRIPYLKVSGGILIDPVAAKKALERYKVREIS